MSGILAAEPAAFVLPFGALVVAFAAHATQLRDRVPARKPVVDPTVTPVGATTPMNTDPQSRGSTG
jgi:hypothetical protein